MRDFVDHEGTNTVFESGVFDVFVNTVFDIIRVNTSSFLEGYSAS